MFNGLCHIEKINESKESQSAWASACSKLLLHFILIKVISSWSNIIISVKKCKIYWEWHTMYIYNRISAKWLQTSGKNYVAIKQIRNNIL